MQRFAAVTLDVLAAEFSGRLAQHFKTDQQG